MTHLDKFIEELSTDEDLVVVRRQVVKFALAAVHDMKIQKELFDAIDS